MLELLVEAIQTNANKIWIGFCVVALTFGFALCAGNIRRQLLIGVLIVFWGTSMSYYDVFYVSDFATYAWFPYWVALEGILLLTVVYAKPISDYIAHKLHLKSTQVTAQELRQESIIIVLSLLSIFTDVGQLGSALAGYGRITGEYYNHFNRLAFSLVVLALVAPGKSGLKALVDALNEKITDLVTNRNNSNRHIDTL